MADTGGQRCPRRLRTGFRAEDEGQPQPRGSPPWPRWQGAAEQADPDPGGRAEAETREAALARSSHGPAAAFAPGLHQPPPNPPPRGRPRPRPFPGAPRCTAGRDAQVCGSAGRRGDAGAQALPVVLAQPLDGVESPPPHTRWPLGGFAALPPTCTGRWATGPPGVWRDARPASVWCLRRARLLGSATPFSSSPAPSSRPGSSSLAASRCSGISRPRRVRFLRCLRTVLRPRLRRLSLIRLRAHSSPPRRPPSYGAEPEHWGRPLASYPTARERGAPRTAWSSSVPDASFPDSRAGRVSAARE